MFFKIFNYEIQKDFFETVIKAIYFIQFFCIIFSFFLAITVNRRKYIYLNDPFKLHRTKFALSIVIYALNIISNLNTLVFIFFKNWFTSSEISVSKIKFNIKHLTIINFIF